MASAEPDAPETLRAVYEVVISAGDSSVDDADLMGLMREYSPRIEAELSRRARQRFGPAYFAALEGAWPDASIRQLVLLAVRYPVRMTAAAADELRRFAGEVEVVIAEALADASGLRRLSIVAEVDEVSIATTPKENAEPPKGAWENIAPVLAAIATGIGVVGFVTFVGGAIQWARFDATGLPKEEALSVVPTQDLVVTGASALVPAILAGLLASAFYLIAYVFFGRRAERISDPAKLEAVEERSHAVRTALLIGLVFAFEIVVFAVTLDSLDADQFIAFFVLGALMILLTYCAARITENIAYLALSVFLALSIFLGGIEYVRAANDNELRGAAVIRNNQKAIVGFFVAENSNRVYIGRLDERAIVAGELDPDSARLIGIQKDQVTDVAIGPPSDPKLALDQAVELARELCVTEPAVAGATSMSNGRSKTEAGAKGEGKQVPADRAEVSYCWERIPPGG
ncbi:MAG TPA: hypothetical protein VNP96_06375 [Solirubrobacterales bacterium]|nr:hypothetical protein [Solirubrobacterales bacterium]